MDFPLEAIESNRSTTLTYLLNRMFQKETNSPFLSTAIFAVKLTLVN